MQSRLLPAGPLADKQLTELSGDELAALLDLDRAWGVKLYRLNVKLYRLK